MTDSYLNGCLHYLAARVAHQIGRHFYHRHLKPRGIRAADWWVLSLLDEHDAGLAVGAIAAHIFYDQPATTRLLERMEEQGLVRRRGTPEDKRKVLASLTDEGRRLASELKVLAHADEEEATSSFHYSELEDLKEALRRMLRSLSESDPAKNTPKRVSVSGG